MLAAPTSEALRITLDQHLEPAEDHPFAVERQGLRIHYARHPRVLHDLGVDAVAMRPRLVHDVGPDHGLARLSLTLRGNDVHFPTLTSSATHSRKARAP